MKFNPLTLQKYWFLLSYYYYFRPDFPVKIYDFEDKG